MSTKSRFVWQPDDVEFHPKDVTKYSDDQPRDETGKWVSSGGGNWPAPKTDRAGIKDAMSAWTGIHFADLREYIRTGSIREGESLADDPIHGISTERAAQSVSTLTAMVEKGADAPPLYRGVRVDDQTYEQFHGMMPGQRVDLSLTSWSSDSVQAERFAGTTSVGGTVMTGAGDNPVILRVDGAKGVDVSPYSLYPAEKEWLTDGRFTVTSAGWEPHDVGPVVGGGAFVVHLSQDAVWSAPSAMVGMKFEAGRYTTQNLLAIREALAYSRPDKES